MILREGHAQPDREIGACGDLMLLLVGEVRASCSY